MKSCIFIALNIVFITLILIEKSHCLPLPGNETDTGSEDANKNITGVAGLDLHELDLGLVDVYNTSTGITLINEKSTDFTNNSSVAGPEITDNTGSKNNSPDKAAENQKSNQKGEPAKVDVVHDGVKELKEEWPSSKLPAKTPLAPKQDIILTTVATTILSTAATKATPQKDLKKTAESSEKKQEIPIGFQTRPIVEQATEGLLAKSTLEVKPDKKTKDEPSDDKDLSAGDDDGQSDPENINGVLPTDDKKEDPGSIPVEKPPKTLPEPVDSHDKKVADTGLFPEQENGHFFVYFMTVVAIFVLGYFLFHNKQKIIALIVEGRHDRRRRAHSYRKLETEGTKGSPAIF